MERQQVLFLWAGYPTLDSQVVAWSAYDGASGRHSTTGDSDEPPYESVVAAMADGWRVVQFPQPQPPRAPGREFDLGLLQFQYVLERMVDV